MRKWGWLRFAALVAALVLVLVACGDDDGESTTTQASTTTAATTTTQAATTTTGAETTTTAEIVVGDPIKIGMIMSLTGTAAGAGVPLANAERLAVKIINETRGGVLIGNTLHPLELVEYDDTGTAEAGIAAATRMIEQDGIRLHVGLVASSVATGVQPYAERLGNDFVNILTGASLYSLTDTPNTYRMAATSKLVAEREIEFAVAQGWTSAVGILDTTNAAWVSLFDDDIPGWLADAGIDLHSVETMERGQADVTAIITKVKDSGVDFVWHTGFPDDELLFIRQARELGWNVPVLLVSQAAVAQVGDLVPAEAMTDVYQASWAMIQDLITAGIAGAQELLDAYVAEYGEEPGFLTMQGYEAILSLAAAIEQAQSAEPADVLAALQCLAPYEGMIWPVTLADGCVYAPDRNALVPFATSRWDNGVLTFLGLQG